MCCSGAIVCLLDQAYCMEVVAGNAEHGQRASGLKKFISAEDHYCDGALRTGGIIQTNLMADQVSTDILQRKPAVAGCCKISAVT